ncbi:MAG: hypothetical protein J7518_11740 [Nocardioidaceae bacterium]|nr:hypothetical protein [Nocardioidaceae bacterium]
MPTFPAQVDRLVTLGYPALAGTTEPAFRELLEPLRPIAATLEAEDSPAHVAYVVVVTRDLVAPEDAVPLLRLHTARGAGEKPGVVDRNHAPGDLAGYHPIEPSTPPASAYLLVDVERGEEFRDVRPEEATATVLSRGRSPLTIDEGIALVTQVPATLERNKCFMLAGSRRGDRRVPALWISERAPKLGWCWDGNPHTWLGLASAGGRVA